MEIHATGSRYPKEGGRIMETSCGKPIIVDEDLLPELTKFSWCLTSGYPSRRMTISRGVSRMVYLHHIVLGNPPTGLQVDHINNNKLDNRRANLRFVTPQINVLNRRVKAKGVSYDATYNRWKAYYDHIVMGKPKRRVNIGTYKTHQEAAKARQEYEQAQNRRPS